MSGVIERIARVLVLVTAAIGVILVFKASPFPGCEIAPLSEGYKAAIGEMDDIVKWGLGLSVGLVAVLGSLLLGLRTGPQFGQAGVLVVLSAILCFAFAAYFAVMWRVTVAQAYLNDCPRLIAAAPVTFMFDLQTYWFMAGLGILGLLGVLVAFKVK